LEPLAGASGDGPQDGSVIAVDGSKKCMAIGLSLLPEWGKTDPRAMGRASMDETMRSLTLVGADPDQIGLLDNFCMGNPNDPDELGRLVECVKGIAEAAEEFQAPFISGKDSFYNYYETEDGPINIPVTFLCSGIGVVEDHSHVTGSSLRRAGSVLCLIGTTENAMGGSVYARHAGLNGHEVPQTDCAGNLGLYRAFHEARKAGHILSAHDVSEGGLAVALAEMSFSGKAGVEIDLASVSDDLATVSLFSESTGRILIETTADSLEALQAAFSGHAFAIIGQSSAVHSDFVVSRAGYGVIRESIASLKSLWKQRLVSFY
jgi:phosphoribosylformylglycinamidine synthase subunit PurSL